MIDFSEKNKQIAILLDPDKLTLDSIDILIHKINLAQPDYIFIGGSTFDGDFDRYITTVKKFTQIPIVLFPGNQNQFSTHADCLLLLSLISGRNVDYIIGQHIEVATQIKQSGIQVIPTSYILIDGGKESATQRISNTQPIGHNDISHAVSTSVAGELLGHKAIYLEAGSGALNPISKAMISSVKQSIDIPLIVGGGIRTIGNVRDALSAGADIIVVGNHFELHPDEMEIFCKSVHEYGNR